MKILIKGSNKKDRGTSHFARDTFPIDRYLHCCVYVSVSGSSASRPRHNNWYYLFCTLNNNDMGRLISNIVDEQVRHKYPLNSTATN
jgi:hypothetical protein